MNNDQIFNSLSRRRIRYLLFRKRDTNGVSASEMQGIFSRWGIELSRPAANRAFLHIIDYYEKTANFTGWEYFAGYAPVSWDVGISKNDIGTNLNRPEKWWLFDKPPKEIIIRGVKNDSRTLVQLETGEI